MLSLSHEINMMNMLFFCFSSSRLYLIFMSTRIIFIIFLWKAKHTHHTTPLLFPLFRCAQPSAQVGCVSSLASARPWRTNVCIPCLTRLRAVPRCSILQRCWWPPHPCPANPSGDMHWFEVILHGSRQPLQKLLTLTSIVSTRKTTCCGWANDGNGQLKHEAKRLLLGEWIYPWILVSFATGFAESLIMSIEHLSLSFLSLELPWTMISTCCLDWRLSQPADKWSICIPHKPPKLSHLVPHKTNNSN